MKYSKCPWVAKGRTVHADGIRISQSGFRGAASVQAERAYDEMLKANAKLIAASPLMLEALEKFVVFHNADHDHIPAWELQSMYDAAINAAKDVIKKATGDE